MRIKLVVDCRMINMSGIGTYLKNILPGIIATNQFDIWCLGYDNLKEFYWFNSINYIAVKARILTVSEQLELPGKIPACDILWSPNWNIPLFCFNAKKKVVTIHDVYHLANPKQFSKMKMSLVKFYMRVIKLTSARIITVSEFSKQEILRYTNIASDKITVINLAVDENYSHDFPSRNHTESNYALFVGNVKPHKNLKLCLVAMSLIKDKNLKFYIVGKKGGFITNDDALNSYIKMLRNRIVFTGEVSDNELKSYYDNAKFFLFPSKYEGFGLPILEAMKFSLPIIASNAASIPEVGGEKLIYFDPLSVTDLVAKIDGLLSGDIKCAVDEYPDQLKKFDWNVTIEKHMQVLRDVLK
jgi:glycosyltransferase involved in cell wall biosynthesis